jgi:hypothetical protein
MGNTTKKVRRVSVYTANNLYNYIPSLLELPDIKCGEFKEKFLILIKGLITDIENINNPDPLKPMLYQQNIHIKNATEVLRAMIKCFHCIIEKINDKNNVYDCISIQPPIEEDATEPVVNSLDSLNILMDTFNLDNR